MNKYIYIYTSCEAITDLRLSRGMMKREGKKKIQINKKKCGERITRLKKKNCKAHGLHHSDDRQIVRGNGTRLQNWYIPQKII